jgi:K+-sensing histidine kinase KdpD
VLVYKDNHNKILLEILDDGMYLSPEQLIHIWLPYYQVEKQLTGQVDGMGLGLPMVASLVWKVGGQCHIYNRTDKAGLVVKLVFPIVKEETDSL